MQHFDLILQGGTVATPWGLHKTDIGVARGKIAKIGEIAVNQSEQVIRTDGLHILPGIIDSQVHFREPGLVHKEDLASGSHAAIMGGVTCVFEMPNTNPPTSTIEALTDKLARAEGRMHCDYAFYFGATADNMSLQKEAEQMQGCAGVKLFVGSSTGNLLVEESNDILAVLAAGHRRMAIHSEDEARLRSRKSLQKFDDPSSHPVWRDEQSALKSTKNLIQLARKAGRLIHILHISTAEELPLLREAKDIASCEVTPQHLTFDASDYERLGTLLQMNPPVRDARHREALFIALREGLFDVIGSDHAPHTLEEKRKPYPESPSGMTGVQTLLPIMLDHVNVGRLSLSHLVDLTAHGPQRIFGLQNKGRIAPGMDADFTIVDLKAQWKINNSWIVSRSQWSPYDGRKVKGKIIGVILRGTRVMWEDSLIKPAQGRPVRFLAGDLCR